MHGNLWSNYVIEFEFVTFLGEARFTKMYPPNDIQNFRSPSSNPRPNPSPTIDNLLTRIARRDCGRNNEATKPGIYNAAGRDPSRDP